MKKAIFFILIMAVFISVIQNSDKQKDKISNSNKKIESYEEIPVSLIHRNKTVNSTSYHKGNNSHVIPKSIEPELVKKIKEEAKEKPFFPDFSEVYIDRDPLHKRFRIKGETNLPDDFKICVSITRIGIHADYKFTVVKNSSLTSNWFYLQNHQQGVYEIELSSILTHLQPTHVQLLIGKNGRNLEGENVKFSTLTRAKLVSYKFNWNSMETN